MSFIEVTSGAPEIADGVYPVTVTAISDVKTVTAQRGAKAGQDIDLIDWTFAAELPDGRVVEVTESTSTATGPRSKMYAWLTALLGGTPPAIGQRFEKDHLIGRVAQAQFTHDEGGWPRISTMLAMSPQRLAQQISQATGTPLAAVPETTMPIRQIIEPQPPTDPAGTFDGAPRQPAPVARQGDDLPF